MCTVYIYVYVCMYVGLPGCLPSCRPACLPACVSVCVFVWLSPCLSFRLYALLYQYFLTVSLGTSVPFRGSVFIARFLHHARFTKWFDLIVCKWCNHPNGPFSDQICPPVMHLSCQHNIVQGYAWLQNETTGPLALSRALEVSGSAAGGVACVAELQDYATI